MSGLVLGSSVPSREAVRRAAVDHHLGDIFDAYETFCAYHHHENTWRALATQLALYLDSQYFSKPGVQTSLPFQLGISFASYLDQLETTQVLHLSSDAVIAILQTNKVLLPSQHLEMHGRSSYLDVAQWDGLHFPEAQALSRLYLQQLPHADLHLLIDGIKQELYVRCINLQWAKGEDSPVSNSFPEILLYLDLDLSPTHRSLLEDRAGYLGWDPPASLFGRVALRASGLWSAPRIESTTSDERFAFKIGTRIAVINNTAHWERTHIQLRSLSHSFDRPNMLFWSSQEAMFHVRRPSPSSTRMIARISGLSPIGDNVRSNPLSGPGLSPIREDVRSNPLPEGRSEHKNERVALYDASNVCRASIDTSRSATRDSKRSSFSDYRSFATALTHLTGSSSRLSLFSTQTRPSVASGGTGDKRWSVQTFLSAPTPDLTTEATVKANAWSETLKERDIIPDPELENWSQGRGQHVQYQTDERDLIPLTLESLLGHGLTARVESVRCKRVRLARKVIRCNRRTKLKFDDALQEVLHLYRAQHSHIVRLVGTYVIDDELVILTYPCAEWNLEQFMLTASTAPDARDRSKVLWKFFTCLAKALEFIHSVPIKHMDIKPLNILVRDIRHSSVNESDLYKIYLTDFGSSKFYPSVEDAETDGMRPVTLRYAAQEVVLHETHGLSADIFSMGCVFTEMLAAVLDAPGIINTPRGVTQPYREQLFQARAGMDGVPRPYHAKVAEVRTWLKNLALVSDDFDAIRHWALLMLDTNPAKRPTAHEIAEDPRLPFACLSCTLRPGAEQFEAGPRLMVSTVAT
jgi:hypothetical protein